MERPIGVLFEAQLRRWVSAKGFWLILGVALLPALFSAAWGLTHTDDVAVTQLSYGPEEPVAGDVLNATASVENVGDSSVGAFNITVRFARLTQAPDSNQLQFQPVHSNVTRVDGLESGESTTAATSWSGGLRRQGGIPPGYYRVSAIADSGNEVGDKELSNDFKFSTFTVRVPPPETSPTRPDDLQGNRTSANVSDVAVTELEAPGDLQVPTRNVTVNATIENQGPATLESANVTVSVKKQQRGVLRPVPGLRRVVTVTDLAPNETRTVSIGPAPLAGQPRAQVGGYWAEASVDVGEGNHDPSTGDNYRNASFTAQPPIINKDNPEPKEDQTVKNAYKVLLEFLHLTVVLPVVGLYYAGGLIGDERREGTLPYLLTRPLERWLLPASKFLAGFLVSVVAVAAGLVATWGFVIALSNAGGITFLTAPLVLAVLSLFAYGSLFTFMATIVDRPYLVGLVFVVGWEAIVSNFVPWVQNLTVSFHLRNLLNAWWNAEDLVFRTTPDWDGATKPLLALLGTGVGFLILAGLAMKHREFPDA